MKKTTAVLLAGLLMGLSGFAKNGTEDIDLSRMALADSVINASIEAGTYPGAVLAVVSGDEIVYEKAYGNRQTVPEKLPMTEGTIFDLASVSKCVGTTLSFMQLVEDGRVRLTDNVSRYIPGFKPWKDPETGEEVQITVRNLLTHSSGLDSYYNGDTFESRFGHNHPEELKKVIATEVGRNFRPGTGFIYSCLNFITLQYILEEVTGQKLCDYATEHVYRPLGLKNTFYMPLDRNVSSSGIAKSELYPKIAATEVQKDGKPFVGVVHDPLARIANYGNSGNAGVFSNAEDLCTIAIALLNGGALPGKPDSRILSPLTIGTMITVPEENAPEVGRALGWDIRSDYASVRGDLLSRDRTANHSGYTGTSIAIDFDNKVAVVLLTNRVHPEDKGSVVRDRAVIANIVASAVRP